MITRQIPHDDIDALRELFVGRSITKVELIDHPDWPAGRVTLDNGMELALQGNEGGCVCGAGDYVLTKLNDMPINGITNVIVSDEPQDGGQDAHTYRLFVLGYDHAHELATFDGDDGNGYYGTGFWITAKETR